MIMLITQESETPLTNLSAGSRRCVSPGDYICIFHFYLTFHDGLLSLSTLFIQIYVYAPISIDNPRTAFELFISSYEWHKQMFKVFVALSRDTPIFPPLFPSYRQELKGYGLYL